MKTPVVILLLITALGCSRNRALSKYVGTWSGSYSSTINITNPTVRDTGTLNITVDANNSAIGILQSLNGGSPTILNGIVDPSSGDIAISKYGEGDYGVIVFLAGLNGNLSVQSGSGTLAFPWATLSRWRVTKN